MPQKVVEMDLEQDYLEYVIQFSIALFAVSAAYFINPSNLLTLSFLLIVPMLFGYTAYISRDKFKYSSLLAFISLMFVPLNPIMAAVAITLSIGNVMVSFFAGGTQFKDYYRATMLPLLFTGLILGGVTYAAATYQPNFGDELRTGIGETIGDHTSTILDETNLAEMQKDANREVVKQVSTTTITSTQAYVINETKKNLSLEGQQAVLQAFSSAQEEIPEQMVAATEETQQQTKALKISDRVSDSIENLLSGKKILVLVPVITFGMYGLQPVIGLLTAIFAKLTQRIARPKEAE